MSCSFFWVWRFPFKLLPKLRRLPHSPRRERTRRNRKRRRKRWRERMHRNPKRRRRKTRRNPKRKLRKNGTSNTRQPTDQHGRYGIGADLDCAFAEEQACGQKFVRNFATACRKMSPLVEFTTRALGQKY